MNTYEPHQQEQNRQFKCATFIWIFAVFLMAACNKPKASKSVQQPNEPASTTQIPSAASLDEPPEQSEPSEGTQEEGESLQPNAPPPTQGSVLRVFVPDGLKPVVTALATAFSAADKEVAEVNVSSTGDTSNAIAVPNLDIVIYPSWSEIEALASAQLLASKGRTVTHLAVRVQVSGKQANRLRTPADLSADGVRVGIPPQKLDGGAALRLIARANLGSKLIRRTLPRGEESALRDGTIDAWIGFYPMSVGVPMRLPASLREHQPVAAGILKQTQHLEDSKRFMAWLEGPEAQKLWEDFGTIPVVPNGLPVAPTALPIKVNVPTHKAATVAIDNRILVIGGRSSGLPVDRLAWVDIEQARSFELATKLPEGREGASAIYHRENRRVLVFAGKGPGGPLNTAVRIDPAAETVERLDIVLPDRRGDAAIARVGQNVLLFGGRTDTSILDSVTLVDLVASQATLHKVRLPYPVASAAAEATPDGKVWVVGGESNAGEVSSIIEYSHDTGAFKKLGLTLPGPVMGHALAPYDAGLLVLGGRVRNKLRDAIDYISFEGEATRLASRLLEPTGEPAAINLGGKVFVVGGLTHDRISSGVSRFPF
jgi:hypothetical protein